MITRKKTSANTNNSKVKKPEGIQKFIQDFLAYKKLKNLGLNSTTKKLKPSNKVKKVAVKKVGASKLKVGAKKPVAKKTSKVTAGKTTIKKLFPRIVKSA